MRNHCPYSLWKIPLFEKLVITCWVTFFVLLCFVSLGYAEDWKTKQGFHYNADHFYYFGGRLESFEPRFGIEKNHYRAEFMLTAAWMYERDDKKHTVNTQYKFIVNLSWSPIDNQVEEHIAIRAVVPYAGKTWTNSKQIGKCPVDPVLYSSGGQPPQSYAMTSVTGNLYGEGLKAIENEMNVYATTNESNWKVATNNLLTLAFVPTEIAAQLRQKYEQWTAIQTSAPIILLPKENSIQKDPSKIEIEAFIPDGKDYLSWPCDNFLFYHHS